MEVNGVAMDESASMLRYLAIKVPELNCFYPDNLELRQRIDAALDFNAGYFRPNMIQQMGAVVLKEVGGLKQFTPGLKRMFETGSAMMTEALKKFEARLARQGTTFVCGNEPTIADF